MILVLDILYYLDDPYTYEIVTLIELSLGSATSPIFTKSLTLPFGVRGFFREAIQRNVH